MEASLRFASSLCEGIGKYSTLGNNTPPPPGAGPESTKSLSASLLSLSLLLCAVCCVLLALRCLESAWTTLAVCLTKSGMVR